MGARGFFVVVPDFFHGDPILPDMDPDLRDTWFVRHDATLSLGEAEGLVQTLRSRGFTKVTAAGFCWGGTPTPPLMTVSQTRNATIPMPKQQSVIQLPFHKRVPGDSAGQVWWHIHTLR